MQTTLMRVLAVTCASATTSVSADTVTVGNGQILTESAILAGSFEGQGFTLGAATEFNFFSGSALAPVGSLVEFDYAPLDFLGSTLNLQSGSRLISELEGPSTTSLSNVAINSYSGSAIESGANFQGNSTLVIDGGTVGDSVSIWGNSSLHMIDGSIGSNLYMDFGHDAYAVIDGGQIEHGFIFTLGQLDINAGRTEDVTLLGGQTYIRGGTISGTIGAYNDARVSISGGHFKSAKRFAVGSSLDLVVLELFLDGEQIYIEEDVPFDVERMFGTDALLQAVLADGSEFELLITERQEEKDSLTDYVYHGVPITVHLVPSPSTLVAACPMMLVVFCRRRSD